MYHKKILSFIIVIISFIILTGSLSAYELGYIGGADSERGIVLEGIEFNIPEGYVKNNSKTIVNQTNSTGNITFVLNQETFENFNGDSIIISVVDYDDFDVDADVLSRICKGIDKKTMMGYPGYMSDDDGEVRFAYAFNNKAVSIIASSEDLINQVLVVEDA